MREAAHTAMASGNQKVVKPYCLIAGGSVATKNVPLLATSKQGQQEFEFIAWPGHFAPHLCGQLPCPLLPRPAQANRHISWSFQ